MVPVMVCVSPALNVSVSAELVVFVRLLKVVEPVTCWFVPSSCTVPLLFVNVPPVCVKLPETFVEFVLLEAIHVPPV